MDTAILLIALLLTTGFALGAIIGLSLRIAIGTLIILSAMLFVFGLFINPELSAYVAAIWLIAGAAWTINYLINNVLAFIISSYAVKQTIQDFQRNRKKITRQAALFKVCIGVFFVAALALNH